MRRDEARAKANVGYVPDATDTLPELLVREFIDLVAALKRVRPPVFAPATSGDGGAMSGWIERLELAPFWGQSMGTLSFGQRKRVCLLAALCGDPPLLVLDEPSNGLDPGGVDRMVAIVREREKSDRATLLSTNDAAFAARVGGSQYCIAQGTLVRAASSGEVQ